MSEQAVDLGTGPTLPSQSSQFQLSSIETLSSQSLVNNTNPHAQQLSFQWEFDQRMMEIEKRMKTHEDCMWEQEQYTVKLNEALQQNKALMKQNKELLQKNEWLEEELAITRARITELETQAQQPVQPQPPVQPVQSVSPTATGVDPEKEDEMLTGTIESIHAATWEEWEERKKEIAVEKSKQQQQQQLRFESKMNKLDQQRQAKATTKVSYAEMTGHNVPKKKKTAGPPPEKLLEWAHRILTPATNSTAYTIVYMPSPHRTTHSEIRCALRILGIAQERIIDVHFPAHGVVGLLVHSLYEKDLRHLLQQAKLSPKDEFSLVAASTIGDPNLLAKLNESERGAEAKRLYQERMLTMCLRMPKKHLGVAILRHFTSLPQDNDHHIDQKYWDMLQEKNPKPVLRKRQWVESADEARKLFSLTSGDQQMEAMQEDQ